MNDTTSRKRLTLGDIAGRAIGFGLLAIVIGLIASAGILGIVAIWGVIL